MVHPALRINCVILQALPMELPVQSHIYYFSFLTLDHNVVTFLVEDGSMSQPQFTHSNKKF